MTRRATLSAVACAVVLGLGLGALPASGAGTPSAAYTSALALGIRAYIYGIPLLDSERVFRTSTSTNVQDGSGAGPVNQFSHFRRLANPLDRTVVAPNHDTLYSMAWLDISRQPMVLHMPLVHGRFTVMELLDPYTENFAEVGSVGHPPGNYAIAGPHWRGRLPRGVHLIRAPQDRVWVIGRTYIRNAADTPNVVRIQNEYGLTPLDRWGTAYRPARPRHVVSRPTQYHVPGTTLGANPLAFFDALGDELRRFPPPTRDRPLLTALAGVGIGPGRHPSTEALSADVRQALHDAVAAGAAQVKADTQQLFLSGAPKHNGWLVASTGTYGTRYTNRAMVDAIGLGAPRSYLAMYPFTVTDRNLRPLNGSTRYVAHVAARYIPFPARSFWSLTMYDSGGFFVPNSAHVYLINNRSPIVRNADGSLDIYIQPNPPSDAGQRRNWLPSPAGRAFRLILRLYRPVNIPGILSGQTWQPPTVLPCLSSGMTADGVACAS
jgi:DNA sulfur modification protein DndE